MKRSLSLILCFVLVITSMVFIYSPAENANAAVTDELEQKIDELDEKIKAAGGIKTLADAQKYIEDKKNEDLFIFIYKIIKCISYQRGNLLNGHITTFIHNHLIKRWMFNFIKILFFIYL